MRRSLLLFLLSLLALALQVAVLPAIHWSLPQLVNLPLFLVASAALLMPWEFSLLVACYLGLLADLYTPFFFGFHLLVFILALLLIKFFHSNFLEHKNLGSLLVANLIALIVFEAAGLLTSFFSGQSLLDSRHWLFFFLTSLIHGGLSLLLYLIPGPFSQRRQNLLLA